VSTRSLHDTQAILQHYAAGYFPLYDWAGRFYWERLPVRAIIPLNDHVAGSARRMAARSRRKFSMRYNERLDDCIRILQNERVKPMTWVRTHVARIYRILNHGGFLHTVEAYNARGRLVGGLVAILLPGVVIAETMFSLEPDASKVCLCDLVERFHAAGFDMIDVQTPHDLDPEGTPRIAPGKTPHPCVRLGEEVLDLPAFMHRFTSVMSDRFDGAPEALASHARRIKVAHEAYTAGHEFEVALLATALQADPLLHQAWRVLQHNTSQAFIEAFNRTHAG